MNKHLLITILFLEGVALMAFMVMGIVFPFAQNNCLLAAVALFSFLIFRNDMKSGRSIKMILRSFPKNIFSWKSIAALPIVIMALVIQTSMI